MTSAPLDPRHLHTLALIFTAPTHEGMVRLSWRQWLLSHRDGHPFQH